MRTYRADEACGFRFSRAEWGEFSNFYPLPAPIPAGPWLFPTSEHVYQAAKFSTDPDVQARIAAAPTARDAARIGRDKTLPADPLWTEQRIDVMRWVLRRKLETHPGPIGAVLDRTGERPIVEISNRDPFWGALGRLWMELRKQRRDEDPLAASENWLCRIRIGRLAELPT